MNESMRTKIRAALEQLDHDNSEMWTDDGLPRTQVVQKLANDANIKRSDINEASPGFARRVGDAMGDPPEVVTGTPEAHKAATAPDAETDVEVAREVLDANVKHWEGVLAAAQRKIAEGHKEVIAATKELDAARQDRRRRFPPLTAMDNIKQFIASENVKRAAALGRPGHYQPAQIDMAWQRGNSRGWQRPVWPVRGVDGKLVMPERPERRSFPQQPNKPVRV